MGIGPLVMTSTERDTREGLSLASELARMTALFQVRTIALHMGDETPQIVLADDGVEYRFTPTLPSTNERN
jgi:hypothetical protein